MSLFLFFFGGKKQIVKALQNRAMIIDIRTPHEYDGGSFPGSLNIPIERVSASIERIRGLAKPVIICGGDKGLINRSVAVLKRSGVKEVYAGGSWEKVFKIMEEM